MLYFDDSDCSVVVRKIQRARRKCENFSHLLGQEGDDIRTSGGFYMAVVQSVLIFGSDLWAVMPLILRELGSLHHQFAQQISGRIPLINGKLEM